MWSAISYKNSSEDLQELGGERLPGPPQQGLARHLATYRPLAKHDTVQAFWPFVSRGNSAIVFLAGRQDVHDKSPTRRQFSFGSHGYSPFLHHSKAGDAGDAAGGRGLSYKSALHISTSGRGSRPNRFPWAYNVAWLMLIYSTRQSLGINEACHAISSQPLMRTVPSE